jgi:hypothetical protein
MQMHLKKQKNKLVFFNYYSTCMVFNLGSGGLHIQHLLDILSFSCYAQEERKVCGYLLNGFLFRFRDVLKCKPKIKNPHLLGEGLR